MPQKLPLNNFEWVEDIYEFDESFTKSYNEESDEGYFFDGDMQYLENLHNLHNDLPVLSQKMKIEQVEKLVPKLHDKEEYVIHIRNLEQVLNHGLVLKKVHRVFNRVHKFKQEAWLKPCIDVNTDLRKKAKNDFNYYLVSEPNHHTAKFFTENMLAVEMRKLKILLNKPVCLGLQY